MLKDGLTYLCFATAEKKTAVCFSFLDEIRLRFLGTYETDQIAKAMAYSTSFLDFKRVLKDEMIKWSAVEFSDAKIENVSRKIDKVKDTMKVRFLKVFFYNSKFLKKGNIDKLWERDSQIEDLLEKTELLETETKTFKTNTNKLASHFWWKNCKGLKKLIKLN
jgi:vesicle-associated membrane protein 7